jgi:flavin reductase (DIM6/NTAB) family NADH-FMN oxidoreductase RutF
VSTEPKTGQITPRHYRDVLGHYPTGVAVVTSMGSGDEPIGMAVGSFTAVSLDPPLVAFLPDRGSSTFPAIREAGTFCVNVVAGGQEELCRRFATKGADRFGGTMWHPARHTGSPVLADAVAWIDCEMGDIHEAGDHLIVVGRVVDLEVQTPTLPLLFFQGGYGTFAPRSLVLAARGRLTESVRMADAARHDFERLAADVGLECRIFAQEEDHIVIVATAGHANGIDPVGAVLPFFPPFGYTIAAWGSTATRQAWYDAFPAELSEDDRRSLDETLDAIRSHGWALTFESAGAREAQALVEAMAKYGRTPDLERRLVDVGRQMTGLDDPSDLDEHTARKVRTITAPVFGPNGPVLHPTLYKIPQDASLEFIEHARDALLATCKKLSERFGGTPAGERPRYALRA